MGIAYTKTENRICPICGKSFLIIGKHDHSQKYCSDECRNHILIEYGWKSQTKIPDEKWKFAYLAAMIDGEGSIIRGNTKSGSLNELQVANTSYELMIWLKDTFGGTIRTYFCHRSKNAQYRWEICRMTDVHDLLLLVLPYLIIKKNKAEKMIKDIEIRYNQRFKVKEIDNIE